MAKNSKEPEKSESVEQSEFTDPAISAVLHRISQIKEEAENQIRTDREGRRICITCGHPISPERIEAVPTAFRCIRCQIATEGRHSRFRL